MPMMKLFATLRFTFIASFLCLSSMLMGQYDTNNNLSGGPYAYTSAADWDGTPAGIGGVYNAGAATLTATQDYPNININQYTSLGSYANNIDFFAVGFANVTTQAFKISDADTLIVYGDMNFANKSMELVVGTGSLLVIFGDLNMDNQVSVASGGTVVVSGAFNFTGAVGNNDYAGTPSSSVYASSYSTNASDDITGNGGTPADLSTDLQGDNSNLFDFVNSGGNGVLPITLKEFKAVPNNSSIGLNWTTLTEENFEYFEIQRAAADGEFLTLAAIKGNGFSKEEIDYSWNDENPRIGLNYYRLESVDYDGYREKFPTVAIIFEPADRQLIISPNPVPLNASIKLNNTFSEQFSLQILGLDGSPKLDLKGIDNSIQLPASLKAGIYLAVFEVNGLKKTQKLIIR
jgi:hypothetical protein